MRTRRVGLLAAAAILIASVVTLLFTGSVVLFDLHDKVASAHLVDGWGHRQDLATVGFAYVAVPHLEGTVEIKCKDGTTVRSGYVTPGAPMWQSMRKERACSTA